MSAVASQMVGADFLKLRKKRGTLIWSLVLVLLPLLIYFIVRAVQHSSNPVAHEPAGGVEGYRDALRILAVFFGPLAAILIGTDAGAGDLAAGVFRDLVATGRSRVALFCSRVPAAVGLSLLVMLAGYALVLLSTFVFADGKPTPSGAEIVNGLGFSALSIGVVCAIAVGFASLVGSRPAALTVLIGWHLVASPVLASISSLGSSRKAILSQAIDHFSPVRLGGGGRGATVSIGLELSILVLALWLAVFLVLGAWRTRTMDV